MLIKETGNLSGEGDHISGFLSWLAINLKFATRKIKLFYFHSQYFAKKILYSLKGRHRALFGGFSNNFPAINLKRSFDTWDYALNFSGEMLTIGLVIIVAAANVAAFGVFTDTDDFSDNSLAGQLLARHNSLNLALYSKQNSIKTTIVKEKGLISAAYADDGVLSSNFNSDLTGTENVDGEFQDNVIVAPTPDTTRELMSKQIQVYETQPGDTLTSLSKKFGVSVNTIKWSNNLGNTIKPGWFLMIPPINGVIYQADSNDTLPDIAQYFHGDLEKIVFYNNLGNAEDIDAGQWIICPDCTVPAPTPAPTPKPQPTTQPATKKSGGATMKRLGKHVFPKGYCTYYVSTQMAIDFGGNAKNWLTNAAAAGYRTGKQAVAGAAIVTTDNARYGHVAYVTGVKTNGDVVISEMNYEGFNKINTRVIPADSKTIRGYIYPK